MSKQAAQDAINDSETVRSPIIQTSGLFQVFLFSFDLPKRVVTEIANPIAIKIAQFNQTNPVICQLSSFFVEILPNVCKENL